MWLIHIQILNTQYTGLDPKIIQNKSCWNEQVWIYNVTQSIFVMWHKVYHPPFKNYCGICGSHSHGSSVRIMTVWGSYSPTDKCGWKSISRIVKCVPAVCRKGSPTSPRILKAIFSSKHSLPKGLWAEPHQAIGSSYLLHSSSPH